MKRFMLPLVFACAIACVYILYRVSNPPITNPVNEAQLREISNRVKSGPTLEQVILDNGQSLETSVDPE